MIEPPCFDATSCLQARTEMDRNMKTSRAKEAGNQRNRRPCSTVRAGCRRSEADERDQRLSRLTAAVASAKDVDWDLASKVRHDLVLGQVRLAAVFFSSGNGFWWL